jgi:hypothetical protein
MFGPGETNKVFTVPILPDGLVENHETINLALANPIGGVILGYQETVTLTISDNSQLIVNAVNRAPALTVPPDQTITEPIGFNSSPLSIIRAGATCPEM